MATSGAKLEAVANHVPSVGLVQLSNWVLRKLTSRYVYICTPLWALRNMYKVFDLWYRATKFTLSKSDFAAWKAGMEGIQRLEDGSVHIGAAWCMRARVATKTPRPFTSLGLWAAGTLHSTATLSIQSALAAFPPRPLGWIRGLEQPAMTQPNIYYFQLGTTRNGWGVTMCGVQYEGRGSSDYRGFLSAVSQSGKSGLVGHPPQSSFAAWIDGPRGCQIIEWIIRHY
ncbi:hypothetical protein DFH06DRAFT_1147365 [Mycena polygramma]|nr:hypothetical protein DFH06DRAFT_1147365 [Mycena polygramma]